MRSYGTLRSMHAIRGNRPEERVRTPEEIGQAIREARSGQGLTQEEVALLTGTHRNRIQEVEAGHATERLRIVLAIIAELGLELVIRPRDAHRGRQP